MLNLKGEIPSVFFTVSRSEVSVVSGASDVPFREKVISRVT